MRRNESLRCSRARRPPCVERANCDVTTSQVLSPSEPLVFLDTAGAAPEASGGASSSCNPGECEVVAACLRALVAAGMDPGTAAVVSPYRAQVNALTAAVGHGGKSVAGAEVLTIDKSQVRSAAALCAPTCCGTMLEPYQP